MKELTIPEGRVVKLYSSGKLLWERQGDVQTFDYLQFPGTAYFNTGVTFSVAAMAFCTR